MLLCVSFFCKFCKFCVIVLNATEFRQFRFFYISKGSTGTHLRYGGQCGMSFVANSLENTTVNTICKSANIYQRYKRM